MFLRQTGTTEIYIFLDFMEEKRRKRYQILSKRRDNEVIFKYLQSVS